VQDGQTPLHTAILSGTAHAYDVIPLLLDHGADINAQTRGDEDTPLHLVVEHGEFPRDFAVVNALLDNNVDLSIRNKVSELVHKKKQGTQRNCEVVYESFQLPCRNRFSLLLMKW
jgi:ankyrin repeat protein